MATLTSSHPKDKKLTYIFTVPEEGILYIRPTALSVPIKGLSALKIEEIKDHEATEDELFIFIRLEGHPAIIMIQQDQEIKLYMHPKCTRDKHPEVYRMNDLKPFEFDSRSVEVFGFQKNPADVLLILHSEEKAAGRMIVSDLVLAHYRYYAEPPILAKTRVEQLSAPNTSLQEGFMSFHRGKHPLERKYHDFNHGTNATQVLEGSNKYLLYLLDPNTVDPAETEFEAIKKSILSIDNDWPLLVW
ncbi:hypothetical protein F5880DRAFT_1507762 [Lentinula raphanica]|nr:hypothetical protein F5880DRAFT_1507762 [Lentinula raphanica]